MKGLKIKIMPILITDRGNKRFALDYLNFNIYDGKKYNEIQNRGIQYEHKVTFISQIGRAHV